MCSRYHVDEEVVEEMQNIIGEKIVLQGKIGDIYPTENSFILLGENNQIRSGSFSWGFLNFNKKGVIFNARSETALEKKMFQQSVLNRRCVIPARGFYEWDANKNKVYFTAKEGSILWIAGFYKFIEEKNRFVILTTNPNESIIQIHNRMPLLLEKEQIRDWIFDAEKTTEILSQVPILLKQKIEYKKSK